MKEVVLVAGGVSIRKGIDTGLWDKIKHLDVWSINYAYLSMPYLPEKELFVDRKFFTRNINSLEMLSLKGVQVYSKEHIIYNNLPIVQYDGIKEEYCNKKMMQEGNTRYIGTMGLSGFFALSCAIAEDYDRIYLLGYDCGTKKKGDTITHFYQDKLEINSCGIGNTDVYYCNDRQDLLNVEFNNYNEEMIEIYNVSPDSNLQCFPKINYEQFFNMIKE